MQNIKITSGDWEILETGSVHSKKLNPVEFELTPEMTLRIAVKKSSGDDPSIDIDPSGNTLTILHTNPKSIPSFGSIEPIEVGLYNGRTLYVQARITVFGDYISFRVHYTFFLGSEHD